MPNMLLEKSREITPARKKRQPKQKQCPVVDVTDDRSKVQCCKEQHCIGTWNIRSLNQGKLEVVKQEILNGLPWKQTEIILLFLRLHPSTAFETLLLIMMAFVDHFF